MIGDDHIDAGCRQCLHRIMGTGATITGDHERRPNTLRRFDPGGTKIVPVRQPIRDKGMHSLSSKPAQHPNHECRRCHAIHVIVAVNKDHFLTANGLGDAIDGARDIVEQRWRRQLFQARAQELLRSLCVAETARD
jgi:hypothetical protein